MIDSSWFGDGGTHVFGAPELFFFLLANAIIWAICFPRVWKDLRKWRAERDAA
jgi:hypothetical protein